MCGFRNPIYADSNSDEQTRTTCLISYNKTDLDKLMAGFTLDLTESQIRKKTAVSKPESMRTDAPTVLNYMDP